MSDQIPQHGKDGDTKVGSEQELRRPGISDSTLGGNGIRRVTMQEARELVGLPEAGVLIPYCDSKDDPILDRGKPFCRLRLDCPDGDRKYHSPKNSTPHLYIPAATRALLCETGTLVVVEGEFKAMSLAETGVAAVGLSGFYAILKNKDGKHKLIPELAGVIADNGIAEILFLGDSDTALNWQFADAAMKLSRQVHARVLLPRIPLDKPKGIDDCRDEMGDAFGNFWSTICKEAIEVKAKMKRGRSRAAPVHAGIGYVGEPRG